MLSSNSLTEFQLHSAQTIYKEENFIPTFTEARLEDLKSTIRIGQANEYLRALPKETSGFYKYAFLCLFNIFAQWHVLYFITLAVAKIFFLCLVQIEAMISELILIGVYLILEVYLRYKTYSSYILSERQLQLNKFQIWSNTGNEWLMTQYRQIKPGQIIRIKQTAKNNNIVNPVNLLPIYLPSKKSYFQLKTTNLNKSQEIKDIPLLQIFKKNIHEENPTPQLISKLQKIKLYLDYSMQNKNLFQGKLKVDENQIYYISNRLILPQGVPIINEEFIVGVVLANFSNINQKSLKTALNAKNQTTLKTGKTLLPLVMIYLAIGVISFIVQFLLMQVYLDKQAQQVNQEESSQKMQWLLICAWR